MKLLSLFTISVVFTLFNAPNVFANAPCDDEAYRQFDFWLGNWQVKRQNGKVTQKSQSKISRILNGCVILEEYSTPTGFEGKSLNIYDKSTNKWHQTWTDNTGLLLQLSGQWNGKSMVLAGTGVTPQGESVLHKISWTPGDNGKVRQVWHQSLDSGKNWQPLFDGVYTQENEHSF